MADYQNRISILIAAQDEASAVTQAAADRIAAAQAQIAAASEEMAATTTAAQDEVKASSAETAAAADASTTRVKTGALMLVGAIAVTTGAMVKSAGDFQASMVRLVTSAGESQSNLKLVSDGVLQVAQSTGTSTKELAQAMYMIESGGFHGAAGLNVLKAAAQGAKTENADLATVSDAVTSAMTDYHYSAAQAADVTSKLVAATGQGKTTFQDLAGAMSALLPKASAAGISLNEILGDLASMTLHGISAQQAAENMADAIAHLQSPTQAMSKELAALGLNSTQLSQNLGKTGLSGTIEEIAAAIRRDMGPDATKVILNMQDALKGLPESVQAISQKVIDGTATWKQWNLATKDLTVTQRAQAQQFATLFDSMHAIGTEQMTGAQVMQTYAGAMNKAMGDSAGLNVALMLTGQNTDNTTRSIQAVTKATADASGNVKGWGEIQGEFNQQMSVLKETIGTTGIAIGSALLPPLTVLARDISDVLEPVASFINKNKDLAAGLLLTAGGFGALAGSIWAARKAQAAIQDSFDFLLSVKDDLVALASRALDIGTAIGSTAASWSASLAGMVADSAKATASFVKDAALTAAEWAKSLALMAVNSAKAAAGMAADAALAAIRWIQAAHASEDGFLGSLVKIALQSTITAARVAASAVAAAATWVAQATVAAVAWTVTELPRIVAGAALTAVRLTASAIASAAAWVAQALIAAAAWTANFAVMVARGAATAAMFAVQATAASAVWVAKAAIAAAAWVASDIGAFAQMVARGAWTAGMMAVSAAASSSAWSAAAVASAAAWGAATAGILADVALVAKAVQTVIGTYQTLAQVKAGIAADKQSQAAAISQMEGLVQSGDPAQRARATTALHNLGVPGYASGTSFSQGGVALVGEQGPELVNLPRGSQVLNASETRGALNSRGVVIENLNVYNNADVGLVTRQIGWQLANAV